MTAPKRPTRGGWVRLPDLVSVGAEVYERKGLRVLSSAAPMEAPDASADVIPTWLVSVSRRGASMPTDRDLERVRRDFSMQQAEEDNHEDGNARKLFLVVDPARRVDCECKTAERVIERADGYRYSVSLSARDEVPRAPASSSSEAPRPSHGHKTWASELRELLRRVKLERADFALAPFFLDKGAARLPASEAEVTEFIRERTRLYRETYVIPVVERLLARERHRQARKAAREAAS